MKKIIASVSGAALLVPLLASAQALTDINSVAAKAKNLGDLVVGLAISLAVVWIIINIIRYLIAGNSDDKRKEGGKAILYGVVALFVILSIWGLVNILRTSFRTEDGPVRTDIQNLKLPPPPFVP